MEGPCLLPGTTGSVSRKILNMLAVTFLGILVASGIGIGGYFSYKKVMVTFTKPCKLSLHYKRP